MKKDLHSYEEHNKGYENDKHYYQKEVILARTEATKDFERTGFGLALSLTKRLPKIHVDIGSGVGWLLHKMAPHFEKSYGIELSHAAVLAGRKVTSEYPTVTHLEMDIIDGYKRLDLKEPAFFTTGAVFCHIENYYVAEFLHELNQAPTGSVLYFSENYDRNIDWSLWHVRSKEWWRKHLPNWQLIFLDIENGGYASGIYGVSQEYKNVLPAHERGMLWSIYWSIDKYINLIWRVSKKITRLLRQK